MASIALNTEEHLRSDQEAWQELQEERRAMIQALKNNSFEGEKKAEELMQRLKRTLYAKGDDINKDINNSLDRLDSSINQLKNSVTAEEEIFTEFNEITQVWDRVSKYIDYLYAENPDPKHALEGTDNAYPNSLILPDNSQRYNSQEMAGDLKKLYQRHLSPIVGALDDESIGSEAPLRKLSDAIEETVRSHQYLNEYKHILKIALEDEELRRRIAEENGLNDLQGAITSDEEDLQRFNQRLEDLEQTEKRVIERVQEAHEILEKKTRIDDNVIEGIAEEFMSDQGGNSGFLSSIGRSIGSNNSHEMASEKFEEVTMHYEGLLEETQSSGLSALTERFNESEQEAREDLEELNQLIEIFENSTVMIEQNILPAVQKIRETEELDEKLDRRLVNELDEYLEEHRHLFDDSVSAEELQEEAFGDAEQDKQDLDEQDVGQVFQGMDLQNLNTSAVEAFNERVEQGGGPPGDGNDPRWKIFHRNLMELLEMSDRGKFESITQELNDLLDQYESIYREESEDKNVIEDMEAKTNDLRNDLEEILTDVQKLDEVDRKDLRESRMTSYTSDTVKEIKSDLESVNEELDYLYRDILRTEEFNEKEESDFNVLKQEIETSLEDISEVKEVLDNLSAVVDRLKDVDVGRGTKEYADALMLSAMERYGNNRPGSALKERLLGEIDNVNQRIKEIGQLEDKLRTKDHKEVNIEKEEIEEMYTILEDIKGKNGIYTELQEELNPRGSEVLDKHMDGEVANVFTGIKNRIKKIVEALRESIDEEKIVVQGAQQDEAELREGEEAVGEMGQKAKVLEDEIGSILEGQNYEVGEVVAPEDVDPSTPECPLCEQHFKEEGTPKMSLTTHFNNYCPADEQKKENFLEALEDSNSREELDQALNEIESGDSDEFDELGFSGDNPYSE